MSEQPKALDPVAWCQRMIDTAINGEAAYVYHQLKEQWQSTLNTAPPEAKANG